MLAFERFIIRGFFVWKLYVKVLLGVSKRLVYLFTYTPALNG
jgi:hypothetical protein